MPEQVAGFAFWEIGFDQDGRRTGPVTVETLTRECADQRITDLFMFSHGWNNSRQHALDLYERFFNEVRSLVDHPPAPLATDRRIGLAGIIWPSMRWADEAVPDAGGAASFDAAMRSDPELVRDLASVYPAEQREVIEELAGLLDEQPEEPEALDRFQQLMAALVTAPDADDAPEDNGESALLEESPERVFDAFASVAPARATGGAAAFGDGLARLWRGAKEALRQATYWQMKKRAGSVGKSGLGPLIGEVHAALPSLRVHLIGHSFGARLVSFALAGLPGAAQPGGSPVKSLFLLQGAFSHFAFADELPWDPSRGGTLAGMAGRVDGPLVVTHTLSDLAVGRLYPMASLVVREDAAAADDRFFRWAAMGHDGAQEVQATELPIGGAGEAYQFADGRFTNLDANLVIAKGRPPTGSHSDIVHPELAWTALAAARVAGP
jgi:hypothetical protein